MKPIRNLTDLIGLTVTMNFYDYEIDADEENPIEIKVKIRDAYIEDFHFYESWNEPLYVVINIAPIDNLDYYDEFMDKSIISWEHFNDVYGLEQILNIVN